MSINTSTNYTGRTIDALIFQANSANPATALTLDLNSMAYPGGEITTGIQKLVQSFTILFLTEKGSLPLYPNLGTSFVTAMRLGRIQSESDVITNFNLAVQYVKQTLATAAITAKLPADETFASAQLLSFDLNQPNLILQVQVNSVAGTSRVVFLPVPEAIQ